MVSDENKYQEKAQKWRKTKLNRSGTEKKKAARDGTGWTKKKANRNEAEKNKKYPHMAAESLLLASMAFFTSSRFQERRRASRGATTSFG
jgi:hypothetical protein